MDLIFTRGDTQNLSFTRKDNEGNPITTAPTALYFTIKTNESRADYVLQKTLNNGIVLDNTGKYTITILPADTDNLLGSNVFLGCTNLNFVTLEQGFNCNNLSLASSTLYSAETIVSWFEALADRTGQATYTLTIGTTNLNKLTEEQIQIATDKNWTLA